MTGTREKVGAFMELLAPFGMVELMRTGRIAMSRGARRRDPTLTATAADARRTCVTLPTTHRDRR